VCCAHTRTHTHPTPRPIAAPRATTLHAQSPRAQTILALLPNLSVDPLRSALFEVTNDEHAVMYVAALVRSVTSLHDLVANKAKFKEAEEGGGGGEKDAKKGEDKKEGAKKGEEKKGGEKEGGAKKEGAAKK
jgi:hypothetical protein